MKKLWIGIDTGGTFTDLVLCELGSGKYAYHKLPTTSEPEKAVLQGIAEILELASANPSQVEFLVLGTTLATNAVLEGRCGRTGMITTAGFRDILELARQRRPHVYNLDVLKPVPAAPRDCRLEVTGRMAQDGSEIVPLSEEDVRKAINVLRAKNVEAIAVCFMHSYANPTHEQRVRDLVKEMWPEVYFCASSDIMPEFREFERFATTTVNASLMPIMDQYLATIEKGVEKLGVRVATRVMQSNGGVVTPAAVRRIPANTFFSGPAGGVVACARIGKELNAPNLITFDMGGTSTDVSLIRNGEPAKKNVREMAGFPVRTRTIDIHTIGAGGGSIAWIDDGGLLKVGPMSARAHPGPAAYGRGGLRPTVTDANIVLGRLSQQTLLGGRMSLYPEQARSSIAVEVARKLNIDVVQAAAGIIEIINVNMMGAVRVCSIEQGEDPRDFTLGAFGGAGPLHAAEVARNMSIRKVLVPPRPGLLSAIGMLHGDVRGDFSLTRLVEAAPENLARMSLGFEELRRRGEAWLRGESDMPARAKREWFIELRYFGQNFELSLPIRDGELTARSLLQLIEKFHERHRDFYGYDMRGQRVEVVNLRLTVRVERGRLAQERRRLARGAAKAALCDKRPVWFPETGFVSTCVYDREKLPAESRIAGPAIIEQMDSTTVVPPGAKLWNDAIGYLHIDVPPLGNAPRTASVKKTSSRRPSKVKA